MTHEEATTICPIPACLELTPVQNEEGTWDVYLINKGNGFETRFKGYDDLKRYIEKYTI